MNTKQRLALGAVGAGMLADVSGSAVMSGQEMDTDIGIGGDWSCTEQDRPGHARFRASGPH